MYWIYPSGSTGLNVYCDMTDAGGGWTLVLQNNIAVATPAPNWAVATGGNTILGTPSSDLTTFNQLVGLGFWNNIGTTLRAEVGALPTSISHKATYTVSLNSGNFYALGLSNQNILVGGNAPGLFYAHNNAPFTTHDADHDNYVSNCAQLYANHPWWYGACWDGNFLAGGWLPRRSLLDRFNDGLLCLRIDLVKVIYYYRLNSVPHSCFLRASIYRVVHSHQENHEYTS